MFRCMLLGLLACACLLTLGPAAAIAAPAVPEAAPDLVRAAQPHPAGDDGRATLEQRMQEAVDEANRPQLHEVLPNNRILAFVGGLAWIVLWLRRRRRGLGHRSR